RAEWEAAQLEFGPSRPRSGDGLLLSGLVRCSGCRYLTKPDQMTSNGMQLGVYRCRRRHAAGECTSPVSILSRLVDPYVERTFLEALGPHGPLALAAVSSGH